MLLRGKKFHIYLLFSFGYLQARVCFCKKKRKYLFLGKYIMIIFSITTRKKPFFAGIKTQEFDEFWENREVANSSILNIHEFMGKIGEKPFSPVEN